jgi:3,4-dihydroxy 2-butanone 4-phosphate synthase/GTP cyclohydrolase II
MSDVSLKAPARSRRTISPAARQALRAGDLVLLVSQAHNDGKGHAILCGAAGLMSDRAVTQMAVHGRGILSITVDAPMAFRLGLARMQRRRPGWPERSEYLVSIEAAACDGTGISAADRAFTLRVAGTPTATANDVITPGHIIPLLVPDEPNEEPTLPEIAHAIVGEMTSLAGAAWCDVLGRDGDLATAEESFELARELRLPTLLADPFCRRKVR